MPDHHPRQSARIAAQVDHQTVGRPERVDRLRERRVDRGHPDVERDETRRAVCAASISSDDSTRTCSGGKLPNATVCPGSSDRVTLHFALASVVPAHAHHRGRSRRAVQARNARAPHLERRARLSGGVGRSGLHPLGRRVAVDRQQDVARSQSRAVGRRLRRDVGDDDVGLARREARRRPRPARAACLRSMSRSSAGMRLLQPAEHLANDLAGRRLATSRPRPADEARRARPSSRGRQTSGRSTCR